MKPFNFAYTLLLGVLPIASCTNQNKYEDSILQQRIDSFYFDKDFGEKNQIVKSKYVICIKHEISVLDTFLCIDDFPELEIVEMSFRYTCKNDGQPLPSDYRDKYCVTLSQEDLDKNISSIKSLINNINVYDVEFYAIRT